MSYRSDHDRYSSSRSESRRSSSYRSGSGSSRRSSYRHSSSSRSSNRYPQFDYDLDRSERSRSSHKRRPYQKKSWTIGTWRFTERTVYIFVTFILFIVLLVVGISSLKSCSRKKEPEPVPVVEVPESSEESIIEPEVPEVPKGDTWEGLADIDDKLVSVDDYFTYGSHLYFSGSMDTLPQVTDLELVLRPINYAVDLATWTMEWYSEDGTTYFSSAPSITEGPCLETVPTGKYAWLIKMSASTGDVLYRPLVDNSSNDPLDYYTITRDGKNNKVNMTMIDDPEHQTRFWGLDVVETTLPEDVYDFVIDPGHGGNDGGCVSPDGKYLERDIVMEIAQRAYDTLTGMGYKVLLTRDGTEGDDRWMAFEFFDVPDGRVTITYESKAKYLLSIHVNTVENPATQGFQIFGTVRGDLAWGKIIGETITEDTPMKPNGSDYNAMAPGVFFKTLSDTVNEGLFNNKDFLLMVRETGGVATGAEATAWGEYAENIYRFSKQGVESVLVEIGFMSNENDRKIMIENSEDFSTAVVDSYLKLFDTFTLLDPATAPEAVPSPAARQAAEAAAMESQAMESVPEPVSESDMESTQSTD